MSGKPIENLAVGWLPGVNVPAYPTNPQAQTAQKAWKLALAAWWETVGNKASLAVEDSFKAGWDARGLPTSEEQKTAEHETKAAIELRRKHDALRAEQGEGN